ncbi:hypothetical protein GJ496_004269 [Pomphorhynchus laevis]|nr:hypothetical protein GJ496_004269 [Pomphorhynchus laevis]
MISPQNIDTVQTLTGQCNQEVVEFKNISDIPDELEHLLANDHQIERSMDFKEQSDKHYLKNGDEVIYQNSTAGPQAAYTTYSSMDSAYGSQGVTLFDQGDAHNNKSLLDPHFDINYAPDNHFPIHQSDMQSNNGLDQHKIQNDPNPTVIRKAYTKPLPKYVQNISVKFLKPPPVPEPGPIIVKEIRPNTPPAPPPLCIRQRHMIPKTPPPLILRERPPPKPPIIPAKVICKRLPTPPPPDRQVIIERCPPLPPKPQDIIIERWLPYQPLPKRKVIYQRAPRKYSQKPQKNLIIMYEAAPKISRQFHKVGVVPTNPDMYINRFGNSLLDVSSLINNARRRGVFENIEPPKQNLFQKTSSSVDQRWYSGDNESSGYVKTYDSQHHSDSIAYHDVNQTTMTDSQCLVEFDEDRKFMQSLNDEYEEDIPHLVSNQYLSTISLQNTNENIDEYFQSALHFNDEDENAPNMLSYHECVLDEDNNPTIPGYLF